jgi:hypothetical protein
VGNFEFCTEIFGDLRAENAAENPTIAEVAFEIVLKGVASAVALVEHLKVTIGPLGTTE